MHSKEILNSSKDLAKYLEGPDLLEKEISHLRKAKLFEPAYLGIYKRTWVIILSGSGILTVSIIAASFYLSAPKYSDLILGIYLLAVAIIAYAGRTELKTHNKTRKEGSYGN